MFSHGPRFESRLSGLSKVLNEKKKGSSSLLFFLLYKHLRVGLHNVNGFCYTTSLQHIKRKYCGIKLDIKTLYRGGGGVIILLKSDLSVF